MFWNSAVSAQLPSAELQGCACAGLRHPGHCSGCCITLPSLPLVPISLAFPSSLSPSPHPLPSLHPPAPLRGGQTPLVVVLSFVRGKSLQRAHPALFMLAAGPFALFYPASLIRTRDFVWLLKKSAVFPLLPPPSPDPCKFR